MGSYCLKSYIKIYGPPFVKAIRALEKVAVETPEVCIMDTVILKGLPRNLASDVGGYFSSAGVAIPMERCKNIISKSRESLGEHDFFFEWLKSPSVDQFYNLIERIDEALTPLKCYYTITTKPR